MRVGNVVGIREAEETSVRETSISQRKGGGRNDGGGGLLGVSLLSGLSGDKAGNGGSERVFAASIDKLRLEGLDFNFNFFGHILVLHRGRESYCCRSCMISMRQGIGICAQTTPVGQREGCCSRSSFFIGKGHGDNG